MNNPCFLRQLRSENIFKISDKLKIFDTQQLPPRSIIVKQYECKKTLKTIQSKQKVQSYNLSTITDQLITFFQLKQTNSSRPSAFTIAERQFFQNDFLSSIMGQIKQISEYEYQVTGFVWDGFRIQLISLSEDLFVFIITNQMISPQIRKNQSKDIYFKIKQGFEDILSKIINQKTAQQLIEHYLKQLKQLFDKHPQLLSNNTEGQKIINFNLIKYQKIIQLSAQQVKNKMDEEKKQKSNNYMQIQK